MSEMIKTTLKVQYHFEPIKSRHYLNEVFSVFHCHHYTTLYTQLAEDSEFIDRKRILFDVAEENFFKVLKNYFEVNNIKWIEDKIAIAEQYWSFVGMGNLKILGVGEACSITEISHSHIDQGWIKKWGKSKKPINHITRGFFSSVWSLLY
jgi:hypothetical protein